MNHCEGLDLEAKSPLVLIFLPFPCACTVMSTITRFPQSDFSESSLESVYLLWLFCFEAQEEFLKIHLWYLEYLCLPELGPVLSNFYLALMLDVICLWVNMGQFYSDFCLYGGIGFWLQE